ncbi:MAG TPA: V-type ATP synthase subunit F [Candidatus Peribacteraceae bacterium]|nr:V-type ATP synthase subunit F [Candidatus Peribacteraceae bacterium]
MSTYRIAVVGPREAVAGFALLGADVVPAFSVQEAAGALIALKRTMTADESTGRERNTYGIVFVAEDLLSGISSEDQKKLARGHLPAIIPLPSQTSDENFGMKRLKQIVERAVGSDILQ